MVNKIKKYHRDYEQFLNTFSKMEDIEVYTICHSVIVRCFFVYPYTITSKICDGEFLDIFIGNIFSEAYGTILSDKSVYRCVYEI